jgi:rod shape-determining protein MreD
MATLWIVMAIVLMVGGLLQFLLPGYAVLGQAKFPFLLAAALYYALNWDVGVMLVAALGAGLLQDILSPIPLGYSAFCFCLVGWISNRWRSLILTDAMITPVFFGGIVSMVVMLLLYILLVRGDLIEVTLGGLILRMIGAGILGMISTPLVFLLAGGLDRLVGNVEEKGNLDDVE